MAALSITGTPRGISGTALDARRLNTSSLSAATLSAGVIVASVTTNLSISSSILSVSQLVSTFSFAHNLSASSALYYPLGVSIGTHAPGSFSIGTVPSDYNGCLAMLYGVRSHASLTASSGMILRFVANGDIISRDWKGDFFNTGTAMFTFSANEGIPMNSFRKNMYSGSVSDLTYNTDLIFYNEGPFSAAGTPGFRGFRVGPSGTEVWCSVSSAGITSASLTLFFLAIPSLTAL